MLRYIFAFLHNALVVWRKGAASKSYRFGRKRAVIATYTYRSGKIVAVVASESYCSYIKVKAITCFPLHFEVTLLTFAYRLWMRERGEGSKIRGLEVLGFAKSELTRPW